MADKTADDDLDLKPADAGAMFRLEMFTTNVLIGYWKHMLGVIVVILLSIMLYGQYRDYARRTQRAASAEIANEVAKLSAPLPMLSESIATGQTLDTTQFESIGDELVAKVGGVSGTAKVDGLLTAAELFRLGGKVEKQRNALVAAAASSKGVLHFVAESALANLELSVGEGDAAVARLKALSESSDGFLAQQAMLDLGLAFEHLKRAPEADKLYSEFLTKFPESLHAEEVKQRQARVTAAGGAG